MTLKYIVWCGIIITAYLSWLLMQMLWHSIPDDRDPKLPPGQLSYYRMTVELIYKPTGEAINIQYPFVCGLGSTRNLAGERFARQSMYPRLYSEKLPDGSGVAVKTPLLCSATVRLSIDQIVPDDFLPVILYVPDSSNPEFMIAHLSEDSYEQEASKLSFISASITKLDNPVDASNIQGGFLTRDLHYLNDGKRALNCKAVMLMDIDPRFNDQMKSVWPSNKPDYWLLDTSKPENKQLLFDIKEAAMRNNPYYASYIYHRDNGESVARKSGQGSIYIGGYNRHVGYGKLNVLPISEEIVRTKDTNTITFTLHTSDGLNKGFAYCYRQRTPISLEEARKALNGTLDPPDYKHTMVVNNKLIYDFKGAYRNQESVIGSTFYKDKALLTVVSNGFYFEGMFYE